MSPEQLLQELVELAEAAGLAVRSIAGRAGGEGEPAAASGVVRVRGETWVVLSRADPLERRIAVLADGLASHRSAFLEGRYLAPQLRAALEPEGGRREDPQAR